MLQLKHRLSAVWPLSSLLHATGWTTINIQTYEWQLSTERKVHRPVVAVSDEQWLSCSDPNVIECGTTSTPGVVIDGIELEDEERYYVCISIFQATVLELVVPS